MWRSSSPRYISGAAVVAAVSYRARRGRLTPFICAVVLPITRPGRHVTARPSLVKTGRKTEPNRFSHTGPTKQSIRQLISLTRKKKNFLKLDLLECRGGGRFRISVHILCPMDRQYGHIKNRSCDGRRRRTVNSAVQ